jgi:hypothetical protein
MKNERARGVFFLFHHATRMVPEGHNSNQSKHLGPISIVKQIGKSLPKGWTIDPISANPSRF